jgi:hypothetical protein
MLKKLLLISMLTTVSNCNADELTRVLECETRINFAYALVLSQIGNTSSIDVKKFDLDTQQVIMTLVNNIDVKNPRESLGEAASALVTLCRGF